MDIKVADTSKSFSNQMDFEAKKIVNNMAVLKSPGGKNQILTGMNTLKLKPFYLKKENKEL